MKNLTKLSCLETDFDNFKWAIFLVKPKEFADSRRVKINVERLTKTMDNVLVALAGQDPPGDPDTVTEDSVQGNWQPVTNRSPEVQLPVITNPGRFVSDVNWNKTRRGHEKEVYNQNREQYETKEIINQALVALLEEIFTKERWANLNTGNDYNNQHTAQKNLEHLESKYHKDQMKHLTHLNPLKNTSANYKRYKRS